MNKNTKENTKRLVFAALMTASSVVIGLFCKTYLSFGAIRITFENLPVLLTGILLGPIYGGSVGAAADLVTAPVTGSVNPLITLGAASIGIVSGLLGRYSAEKHSFFRLLCVVTAAHTVGSMAIKSIGLWYFYGYPVHLCLMRIPLYIGISLAETYLIYYIYRNRRISEAFSSRRKQK